MQGRQPRDCRQIISCRSPSADQGSVSDPEEDGLSSFLELDLLREVYWRGLFHDIFNRQVRGALSSILEKNHKPGAEEKVL